MRFQVLGLILGLGLVGGLVAAPAEIDGYKTFKFGMDEAALRAATSENLGGPEEMGIKPEEFYKDVRVLIPPFTRFQGGMAREILYLYKEKLSEVRVMRPMMFDADRKDVVFKELIGLLKEKYGEPSSTGAGEFAKRKNKEKEKDDAKHHQWFEWKQEKTMLRAELDLSGPAPAIYLKYRTNSYHVYSAEQSRLKKLKDL